MSIQTDIGLDPVTGDLPDTTRLITGMDLIQQRIRLRLRRGLGEWFLDPLGTGLPLLEWRQMKPPDKGQIIGLIQAEIRAIPGVLSTSNWDGEHDPAARRLTLHGDVLAEDGAVTSVVVQGDLTGARNSMAFGIWFSSGNIAGGLATPRAGRP